MTGVQTCALPIWERPTGSRDPHGLRRQAHGIIRLLADVEVFVGRPVRAAFKDLFARAFAGYTQEPTPEAAEALWQFFWERIEFFFVGRGYDRRNVRSVVWEKTVGLEVPIKDTAAKLAAVAEFAKSEQFRQLATAFKRVRNIARELEAPAEFEAWDAQQPPLAGLLKEPAEAALVKEIDTRAPKVLKAAESGAGFREAYAEAAGFEPAVARFFTEIFVMSDDAKVRTARLRLLKRLERLILRLGDISEIVTES